MRVIVFGFCDDCLEMYFASHLMYGIERDHFSSVLLPSPSLSFIQYSMSSDLTTSPFPSRSPVTLNFMTPPKKRQLTQDERDAKRKKQEEEEKKRCLEEEAQHKEDCKKAAESVNKLRDEDGCFTYLRPENIAEQYLEIRSYLESGEELEMDNEECFLIAEYRAMKAHARAAKRQRWNSMWFDR